MKRKALLMLENGYFEYGYTFASEGTIFGEFVFNTSHTGYEEILTDPSYKGQVVVFTYPLIGNYGITGIDSQSNEIHASAIVVREVSSVFSNFRSNKSLSHYLLENQIIGIHSVDTRSLTKQIRSKGALQGGITTEDISTDDFLVKIKESGSISDVDLYKEVINSKPISYQGIDNAPKILAIDFGIKSNIIDNLRKNFSQIHLVPFDGNFAKNLKELDFDGIFLSNGPGDPRLVKNIEFFIKDIVNNKIPVTGICFGLQMIGKTFGLSIEKLKFGHHGGNHPVLYNSSGKVYITAQNHNYAVSEKDIKQSSDWELTWTNLFDGSVEGFRHKVLPINCVQFHPEASPGPSESRDIVFSEFRELIEGTN